MFEVREKYNTAKIFTEEIDQNGISRIINILNQDSVQFSKSELCRMSMRVPEQSLDSQ